MVGGAAMIRGPFIGGGGKCVTHKRPLSYSYLHPSSTSASFCDNEGICYNLKEYLGATARRSLCLMCTLNGPNGPIIFLELPDIAPPTYDLLFHEN